MPTPKHHCSIIIFAKAPVAGQVKTRLIPYLQAEQATELHRRLVEHTLSIVTKGKPNNIELWCAPNCKHAFFKFCEQKYNVALKVQQGNTLGERMTHAFNETLQYSRFAIILGTDCPILSISDIEHALEKLQHAYDAVISPAEDGGYALLGLAAPQPKIFKRINWGHDNVLSQTRQIINKAKLRYCELDTLWDIDRPEDYERLKIHPGLKHLCGR
ncbi:MAG: glycosyltransferase [Gammaproteobacteria bacterium]|nr:glycosyltransferase [Gammaproteobacteria bacterium]